LALAEYQTSESSGDQTAPRTPSQAGEIARDAPLASMRKTVPRSSFFTGQSRNATRVPSRENRGCAIWPFDS
jgi:hypothetical protein